MISRADTAAILHRLAIAFRSEADAQDAAVWYDHLATRNLELAHAATEALIETGRYFPTVAEFSTAYREQTRLDQLRQQEASQPTPSAPCSCSRGWVEAVTAHGRPAVMRCPRCSTSPPPSEHPKGCTCMDCHYGVNTASNIRAGQGFTEADAPTLHEHETVAAYLGKARASLGQPPRPAPTAPTPDEF